MAISKIILNGVTQMDVTQDTVDSSNLLDGETATGADGNRVVGAYAPLGIDLGITGATVGQVPKVASVDGSGKPTAWYAANDLTQDFPQSIRITTPPTKTTYEIPIESTFDPTGMVVTLMMASGTTAAADSQFITFSPSTFTNTGVQNVTVVYDDGTHTLSAVQEVSVVQFTIDDWYDVQAAVDAGLAEQMLPVGSQIDDSWTDFWNDTEDTYNAPWDVMHYDSSGNMYLKWHYTTVDSVVFDSPEALFYAPEGGLPADQYYILINHGDYGGWKQGHYINFTLTLPMAEGDQFVLSLGGNQANNPTDATWNVYAQGSTVSKQSGRTSDSNAGTKLANTASSRNKTNGVINSAERVIHGYGRWAQSNVRQYLNGSADNGGWWNPQNPWDRPSSSVLRGFLAGVSDDLLDVLEETSVSTAINGVETTAQNRSDITQDKVFLPSLTEMYATYWSSVAEGLEWDYYKDLAEDSGLSGKFQMEATYPALITYSGYNNSAATKYNSRTATGGYVFDMAQTTTTGKITVDGDYARASVQICPCIVIHKH